MSRKEIGAGRRRKDNFDICAKYAGKREASLMFDKVHFMTADIWQIVTLPKKID